MTPLRQALLVAGAVFLVLLTTWELVRSWRARRAAATHELPREPAPAPHPQADLLHADTLPGRLPVQEEPPPPPPPAEEGSRVILALRLVAPPQSRFQGSVLRQALQAEGFSLGQFDIFHRLDEQGRPYLSAANLTQPGSFDPKAMDGQRFGGLSLFAVLPGPRPPFDTFDDLLACARGLNDRLQGALQDERGLPLTPLRVASLRRNLKAEIHR